MMPPRNGCGRSERSANRFESYVHYDTQIQRQRRLLYPHARHSRYTIDIQITRGVSRSCFAKVSRSVANRQASASSANQLTSRHRPATCVRRACTHVHLHRCARARAHVSRVRDRPGASRTSKGGLRKPGRIFVARSTCFKGVDQVRDGLTR